MSYGAPKCCRGKSGPGAAIPRSPAACCVAKVSNVQMDLNPDPSARVIVSNREKKKNCSCRKRGQEQAQRADMSGYSQRLEPRPPLTYRSMQQSQSDYEIDMVPRMQIREQDSGDQDQTRWQQSPLLTPPPLGTHGQFGSPSPIPFDYNLGLSLHESDLDNLVDQQIMLNASGSPRRPCDSPQTQTSRVTSVPPPVIMTDAGPVQASHQFAVQRTVDRYPDREVINRRLIGTKTDDHVTASQIELNFQNVEPGGLNAMGRGRMLHETVSATDTITVAPGGVMERRSETIYEYMKPAPDPYVMDPAQVLEMIEEESKEVEQMKHLQPPELKGVNVEDYGLKKRLQKMKLNPESVRRLESSVINPPPNADEPQEELQPELMAAIMHTEERGLTMDSAPANVYNYLFPEVKDDNMVMRISPVAPSPLQNIVVPVEVPSTLHNSSITREMQFAAANTQCSQGALPVDNIYAKSVLKDGASFKSNNTAMQGKKIRTREMALESEEPPWGAEDLQPLITLVGASPSNAMPEQDISVMQSPSIYHNELENSLEYQLIPEAPRHVSRVQLRGTQKPAWFPGYFIALPDSIKLARSPSEVLPAAWQAVQPDIFADDSFLVVG